jgi:hypothetical protein
MKARGVRKREKEARKRNKLRAELLCVLKEESGFPFY